METAIIVILYLAVILFDFRKVIKQKQKKVIWVYSVILVFSFTILISKSLGFNVPSPTIFIEKIVTSIVKIK